MGRRRLLGAALLLAAAYAGQACAREGGEGMFSLRAPPGRRCARTEDIPLAGLELSAQERALLPYICWEGRPSAAEMETLNFRRGIPPGVNCTAVQWCAPACRRQLLRAAAARTGSSSRCRRASSNTIISIPVPP